MALSNYLKTIPFIAGADFSNKQYRFAKMGNANLTVVIAGVNGTSAVGVIQNNPVATESAGVAVDGVTKVVAGANLAVGDKVTSNATGAAIGATAGATVLGTVVIAATSGGIASIQLDNAGVLA